MGQASETQTQSQAQSDLPGDAFTGLPAIFREAAGSSMRYAIDTPFLQGDNIYATDGYILVWMPAWAIQPLALLRADWSDPAKKRPTATALLAESGPFAPDLHPIRDPSPYRNPCKVCEGTGRTSCCIQCDMEFGDGITIPCQACDGRKFFYHAGGMRVGRSILGFVYLDLLWRHGIRAVRIAAEGVGKPAAAFFEHPSEGWSGLLMPIDPTKTNMDYVIEED